MTRFVPPPPDVNPPVFLFQCLESRPLCVMRVEDDHVTAEPDRLLKLLRIAYFLGIILALVIGYGGWMKFQEPAGGGATSSGGTEGGGFSS